ncbi:Chromosome III, complete sequence, related [Eimeria necatrix]|uniref:Chromosome III, complete sequence, related n=1 Tax=Eimeria necatrix TaxID=51315 RepID=U6N283_9EIME|nr:Chromosome III, complete sequence, related [Eimeria necatrix]CDJ68020.1 Chromosome III, complete sequence, related [Eimeria necatrix]
MQCSASKATVAAAAAAAAAAARGVSHASIKGQLALAQRHGQHSIAAAAAGLISRNIGSSIAAVRVRCCCCCCCCCCCSTRSRAGTWRWYSVLRDGDRMKRVFEEVAAAEEAAEKSPSIIYSSSSSSSSSSSGGSSSKTNNSGIRYGRFRGSGRKLGARSSRDSLGSDDILDLDLEESSHSSSSSSSSHSSSSSSSSSSNNSGMESEGDTPYGGDATGDSPLHVHAEIVLSKEQQEMFAAAEADAEAAAAAAAAERQKSFLNCVSAAESAEGGLRGMLQQSFEQLLPPHIAAAAGPPAAAATSAAAATAAATTAAAGDGTPEFIWDGDDDATLTPAQRFYRDNRDLLLQRAEQYLRGKHAAAAAAASAAAAPGAAASAADEDEEWDDAAQTLEEDWKAFFNPVHKPPKGFRWPVHPAAGSAAAGSAAAAAAAAAAVPPVDLEFRTGQYPSLDEFKSLLAQEGVTDVVCLNLEALQRRDLGLVAFIGTCGTAAHCRRVSRLLRSLISSLEIPEVSDSCSCSSGSTRRNRSRTSSSSSEWFVACLGPVSVHLMTAAAREFYDVERLWSSNSSTEQQQYESQEEFDEDLLHFPNLKREGDALQQQQQLMLQPLQEKHESQCE